MRVDPRRIRHRAAAFPGRQERHRARRPEVVNTPVPARSQSDATAFPELPLNRCTAHGRSFPCRLPQPDAVIRAREIPICASEAVKSVYGNCTYDRSGLPIRTPMMGASSTNVRSLRGGEHTSQANRNTPEFDSVKPQILAKRRHRVPRALVRSPDALDAENWRTFQAK